jgi:hypothetical protein
MDLRYDGNGDPGPGLIDVTPVCDGCVLLVPNPQQLPPAGDLPVALARVLQKWMLANPSASACPCPP